MSEEMTGREVPGTGTTRPSLSSQWGRADGSPGGQGSDRQVARIGPTGRPGDKGRVDGSPGGQGPARGEGDGRRSARGTGTERRAGRRQRGPVRDRKRGV